MKMTRKLIPAFVMLIVSAIMLSTASFAWFATNRDVKANNMSVTANGNTKFLHISTQVDNGFSTQVNAVNASKNVDLINAKLDTDKKTVKWYLGSSTVSGEVGSTGAQLDSSTVSTDVDPTDPTTSKYALINTFYFKMSDTSNSELKNLTVSEISVSGSSSLAKALRVLVVGAGGSQIWKTNPDDLTKMIKADANNAEFLITENITKTSAATTNVKVYVYYDGEDASATSDNATDLTQMTVNVTFTAADA